MADNKDPITTLSISELLTKSKYVIPIYQRNYAWDMPEITQLIQDIIDKSKSDEQSNYYLGTLIVDKKTKNNEEYFEVIDGQQRHTTLTLLNAHFDQENKTKKSNLSFDARPSVKRYIDSHYQSYEKKNGKDNAEDSLTNIIRGINIIDNFFVTGNDLRNNEIDVGKLKAYFLNNVKIIRVNVPKDTDINHYFEIMNTRGVQLEKHQILKAAFIDKIKDDEKLSKAFGAIWDSCSSMDNYIQYNFNTDLREKLFGKNLSEIPEDGIERIKNSFTENNGDNSKKERTLLNILKGEIKHIESDSNTENNETEVKYSSIIDFPNFLLQVLKLFKKHSDVSLDDKNLLKSFGYESNELPDSIEFINFLLRIRLLFDKYIIKRQVDNSNDAKWKILSPSERENNYLVNTFKDEDYKMLMIQSMFHVSFPNNSYKNWLYDLLDRIKHPFDTQDFFKVAFKNANKAYEDRTQNSEWFNNGVGINNFVFNFVDFALWSKYNNEVKGKTIVDEDSLLAKISKQRKYFESFRFTQRSSVEHLHPQSKIFELRGENEDERKVKLDNFGNLCLISRNTNSKYNDYNFQAKKEQFEKRSSAESLKQAIMFSYDTWNTEQIDHHQEEIHKLITT